jgi:hypothetical protein
MQRTPQGESSPCPPASPSCDVVGLRTGCGRRWHNRRGDHGCRLDLNRPPGAMVIGEVVLQFARRGEPEFAPGALVYVSQPSHGWPPLSSSLPTRDLWARAVLLPESLKMTMRHNGAARTSERAIAAERRQPQRSGSSELCRATARSSATVGRIPTMWSGHPVVHARQRDETVG